MPKRLRNQHMKYPITEIIKFVTNNNPLFPPVAQYIITRTTNSQNFRERMVYKSGYDEKSF